MSDEDAKLVMAQHLEEMQLEAKSFKMHWIQKFFEYQVL